MFDSIQKVYLVGIGGIGMSALAKWFLSQGKQVSGSDLVLSMITQELTDRGVNVFEGQAEDHISEDVDLLVYSSAVPEENVERLKARTLGIPEMTYAQALGEMSKQFVTLVVSGTHGKSTTTAMLGLILEAAGLDPTVIVGSRVPTFAEKNFRAGKGKYFVVEGCEYRANMLSLHPAMIVLTNIEEDHLDYYRDLDHIRETFQTFVDQVGEGMVVWNADDPQSRKLTMSHGVSYGFGNGAMYQARNRQMDQGIQKAEAWKEDVSPATTPSPSLERRGMEKLGEIILRVPGAHNISNALAAMAAAMEVGVSFDVCVSTLANFRGIWRRFEILGTWKGTQVISDYGHHPTEIKATLQAAREFYPGRRIVLCFQPHQHARTIALKEELAQSVTGADVVIMSEIYEVAGRTERASISSKDVVILAQKISPEKTFLFARDFVEARRLLEEQIQFNDILIIQGAGDIDDLARSLV